MMKKFFHMALLAILGLRSIVFGANITWIGGNVSLPTDWGTASNWSPATVPGSADTANISGSSSNQPSISFTGGPSFSVDIPMLSNAATITLLPNHMLIVLGNVQGTGSFFIQNATSGAATTLTLDGSPSFTSSDIVTYTVTGGSAIPSNLNFNAASGPGTANVVTNTNANANITIASSIALTLGTIHSANSGDSIVLSNNATSLTLNGGNSTIAGIMSGAGSFDYNSVGNTATLTGANSYIGGTTVSAGTLALSGSGSLASSGALDVVRNSTFDISQRAISSLTIGDLSGGGTVALGARNLTAGTSTPSITFSGSITDGGIGGGTSGSFIKVGSGILTLTGTSTFTGGTTVSVGTLALSGLGILSPSGALGVVGNSTFDISQRTISSLTIGDLSGGGTVALGASNLTAGTSTPSLIFAGSIADGGIGGGTGGSFTKAGSGILTLTGTNTYSGGTAVSAGILALSGNGSLLSSGDLSVASGGTFDLSQRIASTYQIGNLSGAGTVALGSVALSAGTAITTTFSGSLQDGGLGGGTGASFIKVGTGILTFSGSNTYTGITTVSMGFLALSGTGSIATSNALIVDSGAIFDISQLTTSSSINSLSGAGTIALGSNLMTINSTGSNSFTGRITDGGIGGGTGGSIQKTGGGTLTLSGSNSYTGGTTVSAGILALSGSGSLAPSGALSVASSSTFDISQRTTSSTTIGDLSGGGTVALGASNLTAGTSTPSITFSGSIADGGIGGGTGGSFTKAGSGILTLTGTNTFTGGATVSAGTLALQGTGTLVATSSLRVASNSIFDISQLTTSTYQVGDLSGAGTVALGSIALTAGTNTSSVIFSGSIVSNTGGSLTKIGTGTWTLSGTNTFTGGTTITAGTLALSGSGTLASTGALSINSGSTLDISQLTATTFQIGQLSGSGTIALGAIDLISNSSTSSVFSGSMVDGGISGGIGGSFTHDGSQTLILTGVNTYTGGTIINGGTLALSGSGSIAAAGLVTVDGTLDISLITPPITTIGDLSGNGIVYLGSRTLIVDASQGSTFSGSITDGSLGGSFEKAGSATLTLTGNNSYTGTTILSAGTLSIDNNNNLGAVSASIVGNGGTLMVTVPLSLNRSISFNASTTTMINTNGQAVTVSGPMTGTGIFEKIGANTLTLTNSNNNYSGGTIINAGTLALSGNGTLASTGTLIVNGGSTFDISQLTLTMLQIGQLSGSGTIALGAAELISNSTVSSTFSGSMVDGGIGGGIGGSFTKEGSGTLTLTGANTYTGITTISGGTLALSGSGSLSVSAPLSVGSIFDISQLTTSTEIGDLSGSGHIALGSKQLSVNANTSSTIFSGSITDGGIGGGSGGSFVKTGSMTLTLSGTNTFTGETTIGSGILALSGGGALSSTGTVNIAGTFDISQITAPSVQVGAISGAGTIALGSKLLITDTNVASATFSGSLVDGGIGGGAGGSFTKTGGANLILSGTSNYTGTTTIMEGILTVDGSIANSTTFVQSGAILKGTGTIGPTTILSGGTIAAGDSVGTLDSGFVTFNNDSIFQVEINPSMASLLHVTGSASLGGMVEVVVDAGTYPSNGQYLILDAGSITGAFSSVSSVSNTLPRFLFSLQQTNNDLFLLFTVPLSTTNLSGNRLNIANYLNAFGSVSTLSLFTNLTGSSLQKALNAVSPARNAFATYITQQTAFSLSTLLSSHLDSIRALPVKVSNATETAALTDLIASVSFPKGKTRKQKEKPTCSNPFPVHHRVWISGFGELARQGASSQNPSFHFLSEAVLVGYDYSVNQHLIGAALGYAHTHFYDQHNAGHGNINYYFANAYANAAVKNFYVSPAIWGFFDQAQNTRNIAFPGFSGHAKANINAWQILPSLEIGYDTKLSWGDIVFSSLDWVITFQRSYHETGAAPFNAREEARISSMMRSETGLKFSGTWVFNWGKFLLSEKLSYVFQKPFNTGNIVAAFTGIPSTFTVTAVNQTLNLAAIALNFMWTIEKTNPLTINFGYEGEFGAHYWSNELMLRVCQDF